MTRRKDEQTITGINAVELCFQHRPQSIRRAFFTMQQTKRFGRLMSFCAKQRIPYRVVEAEELSRIAATSHHEGACLITDAREMPLLRDWLDELPLGPVCALAAVGVANPHNLGALLRSAAHFGLSGILTEKPEFFTSAAVSRTSQGGAEFVPVVAADIFHQKRQLYSNGFTIVTTSSHQGTSLFEVELPERCIFVVGAERDGIDEDLLDEGDLILRIPGSGNMESLNVSVASGILFAEWFQKFGVVPVPAHTETPKPEEKKVPLQRRKQRNVYEMQPITRKKSFNRS
jgi:RNA methyltransferase, TrmH family